MLQRLYQILGSPIAPIIAALAWTLLLGASYSWNAGRERGAAVALARQEALGSFQKDLVYRRWASMHGGLYVPATSNTPPNPYLARVESREIVGPQGRVYTLLNPAYMTRQVHELAREQYDNRGHITSLHPIRPENRPDPWESNALLGFETGAAERSEVALLGGARWLRFMRPLVTEASCLRCHADQGYRAGQIRGGISVSVPMRPYEAIAEENIRASRVIHLGAWAPVLALFFASWFIGTRRQRDQEVAARILMQSEGKFRSWIEKAPEGILVIGPDGRITDGNPAAESLTGLAVDGLRRLSGASLIQEPMGKAPREGESIHLPERHLLRKNGAAMPVMVDRVRLGDDHELWFLRDLTEHRRLEQDLVHREKLAAVGSLAGGVAHEFNNLLSVIRLQAQQLLSSAPLPVERQQALLAEVIQQTRRGASITSGMLAISRPPKGKVEPCRLESLLDEVLDFQAPAFAQERIAVERDYRSTRPIMADRDQLVQVFLNLTINARHAMRARGEGTLRVSTRDFPGEAGALIADTGIGMTSATQEKLFTPFFTTKGAYAQDGLGIQGTGLGLAVSARVVAQFGGRISVESREGVGTTFTVTFPIA